MTEPKLLDPSVIGVVADLAGLTEEQRAVLSDFLRERGMIAPEPEPVDPLLDEAREIVAKLNEDDDIPTFASEVRASYHDLGAGVCIALTALRRNLELAERPTLTREMVSEVVEIASRGAPMRETFVDCVHAALVERLK